MLAFLEVEAKGDSSEETDDGVVVASLYVFADGTSVPVQRLENPRLGCLFSWAIEPSGKVSYCRTRMLS